MLATSNAANSNSGNGQSVQRGSWRLEWTPRRILQLVIIWTVPGLTTFLQHHVFYEHFTVLQKLVSSFTTWYLCALATPAIIALVRKFRIDKQKLSLLFHVPLGIIFAIVVMATNAFLATFAFPTFSFEQILQANEMHIFLSSILYWLILGGAHAIIYYEEVDEKKALAAELAAKNATLQLHLSNARLDALKMQLRPHFLFNSLHTVSALMDRSTSDARDVLVELSDLLRIVLERDQHDYVPLSSELDWLEKYLTIEGARFSDRLSVSMDIEAGTESTPVPPFILQPIVENAFKHGVEAATSPCNLAISAVTRGNTLEIQVVDTGPGRNNGARPSNGVGVSNTRNRLRALYDDNAAFSLKFPESGGCVAILELPIGDQKGEI